MTRAISVVAAVAVLLTVGWFVGRRPVFTLQERHEASARAWRTRIADLEDRASLAEARGFVWQARAELLLASHAVVERNFGTAAVHAGAARDLLTRAGGLPGSPLDLHDVQDRVGIALRRIGSMEPGARDVLIEASEDLRRLLEEAGKA